MRRFEVSPIIQHASEAAFQATIEEAAQWYSYRSWHDRDSRKNDHGFPDLVLVGRRYRQIVFFECKAQRKSARPTIEQVGWLEDIRSSGHHAYVVKPSDWDAVDAILRGEIAEPAVDDKGNVTVDERIAHLLEYEKNPKIVSRARRRGRS